MAQEEKTKLRLEIAHVLFIDIVGYSKLLIDEQSEALQELNQIVRKTDAVRAAEAAGQLIFLPTGDGMALVFTGSVEEPVECALQISQRLRAQPSLPVRMGIHSGPVHHVADVNQRANIAGAGINIAQRVMDCGDASHILVSKRVADDLAQYRRWQPYLHELGDFEVKHGGVVSVANLYTDGVGNPEPPAKFKRGELSSGRRALSARTRATPSLLALVIGGLIVCSLAGIAIIFGPAMLKPTRALERTTQKQSAAPTEERSAGPAVAVPEKSVAVLPFENLSSDKENSYFTDGIQDEILTKLAGIADLKVISRTSTAKYKSKPEDLKTVSQQLGVANVLEGTVQRAGDKVRVNVQLIDARADSHVWAKSFDREIKDIFTVESEIAQEIADTLRAKLSPKEADRLAAAPTQNAEAYDFFLKGEYEEREAESSLKAEIFDQAAAWYEQAVNRDPTFALAMARLAESRSLRHWFIEPLGETQLREVRKLAEDALTLAPNLAEAHIALGLFYYYGHRQYDEALNEFQRAVELQPNNARALESSGYVRRRQGQWQHTISNLEKCRELDPRNASLAANLTTSYVALRMWNDATRGALQALTLDPHNVIGMRAMYLGSLNGTGDISEARRVISTFPAGTTLVNKSHYGTVADMIGEGVYLLVMERNFDTALKAWEASAPNAVEERARLAARAAIHLFAGNAMRAQDEIRQGRELVGSRVEAQPDDVIALIQLSWINLAAKREADALRLAQRALELLPPEKDAVAGAAILTGLAEIEAQTGHAEEAIKTLQHCLSIPAGISVSIARLKIDPVWDPIRKNPQFQQLLTINERVGP